MKVAVPREIKNNEFRVAITPGGVHELVRAGHEVMIEKDAGAGSAIPDDDYQGAGATIVPDADELWGGAELVLKVKEPIEPEYHRLRPGLMLFTYLHLAADRALTHALTSRGVTAVAYETVELDDRSLPLLAPMSEVAGRLAPQVGATCLMRPEGGPGILLGGVPGVAPARVVILGAGVSGMNATRMAVGMGADVTVLDLDVRKLRTIDAEMFGQVRTIASNAYEVEKAVLGADLVIGAVLVAGARTPRLVTQEQVGRMRPGSVLVDIAIDQGGCFEGSHPTTYDSPTFPVHSSTFYCVANMPGAVPQTSTHALTNATLPYAVELASRGWRDAMRGDRALARGLNVHDGKVIHPGVAAAHDLPLTDLDTVLA